MAIISWSDIKRFKRCERCCYVNKKLNIPYPGPDPDSFSLPNTVDKLRKEEADICRMFDTTLSIMEKNKIEAFPFDDEDLIWQWRQPYFNGGGINYYDSASTMSFSGSIDDVFITQDNKLTVVEFKSNVLKPDLSKEKTHWDELNELQISYYSWLLSKSGYPVAPVGYIIQSSAFDKSPDFYGFNNRLYFKTSIVSSKVNFDQVEAVLESLRHCLDQPNMPTPEMHYNGTIKCKLCSHHQKLSDYEDGKKKLDGKNQSMPLLMDGQI